MITIAAGAGAGGGAVLLLAILFVIIIIRRRRLRKKISVLVGKPSDAIIDKGITEGKVNYKSKINNDYFLRRNG